MRVSSLRFESRRWTRRGLVVALALALLLGLGIGPRAVGASDPALMAQSIQELQQKKKTVDQQRQNLEQQGYRLEQQATEAESALAGLEDTIAVTAEQVAETVRRLEDAQNALAALQSDLEAAEAAYEEIRIAAVGRLQFLQRQRDSEGWAVLLKSSNFNEFLERRYQLKRIYVADRNVLADLKAQADDIKAQRAVIEEQKNSIALIKQELLAKQRQYEAEADQQKQLISRLNQDKAALSAAQTQLARDSEEIAALIRKKVAASTSVVRGTGVLAYPSNGRITSGFGNRRHPILGRNRFHAGVDFGAGHGSTIRAADSGRVIFAGWYGGYGRTVILDHGGGMTTLYAHASRLYVSVGQSVGRGAAIAAVGSTGLSTGPHLHFEVRQNGRPVNPMAYL